MENEKLPKTRNEALSMGASLYFTGSPCKRGHISPTLAQNYTCQECARERAAEWYSANKIKASAYQKIRRGKNIIKIKEYMSEYIEKNRDRIRQSKRKWGDKNRERCRAQGRKWAANNKDKVAAMGRSYRQRNKLKMRCYTKNYLARKHNAKGEVKELDVEKMIKAQRGRCGLCREKLSEYHVDHIIPLSKGGTNEPRNLQILCPPCNRKKSDRPQEVVAREMGLLM